MNAIPCRRLAAAVVALAGLASVALALPSTSLAAPPPAALEPVVRFAQVGDVKLAYYTRGKGPPLLMINGFVSTR